MSTAATTQSPLDRILDGVAQQLTRAICTANGGACPLLTTEHVRKAISAARSGFMVGGGSVVSDFGNGLELHYIVSNRSLQLSPDALPSQTHQQLMKFYGVESFEALVDKQSDHIERLQTKLPQTPSLGPQQVRKG